MDSYKLCYVSGCWVYFTTQALDKQWGDDWNDAPYEHNAGSPYEWRLGSTEPEYKILKLAYEGPFEEPCGYSSNRYYSVEMINRGAIGVGD